MYDCLCVCVWAYDVWHKLLKYLKCTFLIRLARAECAYAPCGSGASTATAATSSGSHHMQCEKSCIKIYYVQAHVATSCCHPRRLPRPAPSPGPFAIACACALPATIIIISMATQRTGKNRWEKKNKKWNQTRKTKTRSPRSRFTLFE